MFSLFIVKNKYRLMLKIKVTKVIQLRQVSFFFVFFSLINMTDSSRYIRLLSL